MAALTAHLRPADRQRPPGAAHRVDHTRELGKETVAGILHNAASVLADLRISQFLEMGFEPLVRPFLIRTHQPRVAGYIRCKDGGEAAGLAHVSSPAARRRPDRNSSRSSGFRYRVAGSITTGVIARNRLTISRAASSRPICA